LKMIVQIYEIQSPDEAKTSLALGVDHIGSVLQAPEHQQNREVRQTIDFVRKSGAISSLIPLFSDVETVSRVVDEYQPDIVHFCEALGNDQDYFSRAKEMVTVQKEIRRLFPEIKIMRSIPIVPAGSRHPFPSLETAELFEPHSDFFLTDTLLVDDTDTETDLQPVTGFVGITGKTCDWDIAAKLVEKSHIPVILAGGISPENVFDAVMHVRPAGVDSCTLTNRVDTEGSSIRFQKDFNRVRDLISETKRAESQL